ncbi:MAG: twin-arginine translocase TatA/TatE family subunit [Kordiimonadaceae bacterium]|jgi:sec-independent protein translocase protein TatA|nr:twin-arginine translocase TatA/TatE family subunit [Kordiimonadaceae bacterium]MDC0081980.1 twin-arginine translocase TatA/TatE family subunit [Emcibacteraceae bacterium]MBT6134766.1 twin-arginine translocase TatA/TatE family subunit [Kordiimonadaceae bacterium]MBT6466905.1 twin-arginine translocase TatA/TatE family subunit [Kordiimonadaceae bacterium]MBT7543715.1 twin-arginine translocase TatA/TatE family subunit [Kordiimonadaceae bacterium]|tara:strand:- start:22380 stop:22616 length:237 start_codon:yes stop_codon:yes gene_type:complete
MGNVGIPQLVIIVVVVVLLFGRGKISGLMSDVAQGIKSFKKGIADDDEPTETVDQINLEQKSDAVASKGKKKTSKKAD